MPAAESRSRCERGLSTAMRITGVGVLLALLLVACGGAQLTATEYASQVEEMVAQMEADFQSIDSRWESQPPSLGGALEYWDKRLEIRDEFLDGISGLSPADNMAEMHEAAIAVFRKISAADTELAARVATFDVVTDHDQWLATPEGEASLAVLEEVFAFCRASQEEFDATADRESLTDVPWLPPELKETVKVAFGCPPEE